MKKASAPILRPSRDALSSCKVTIPHFPRLKQIIGSHDGKAYFFIKALQAQSVPLLNLGLAEQETPDREPSLGDCLC
jgi:hypothetical protein